MILASMHITVIVVVDEVYLEVYLPNLRQHFAQFAS